MMLVRKCAAQVPNRASSAQYTLTTQRTLWPLALKLFLPLLVLSLFGCGGSSSSDAALGSGDTPVIRVATPLADQRFRAGDTFTLSVLLTNFTLNTPADRDPNETETSVGALKSASTLLKDHSQPEHTETHEDSAESSDPMVEHHNDAHGDEESHQHGTESESSHDHDHGNTDTTNPDARQGHMHIYLNDAAGSDPHITAWVSDVPIELPADLPAGMHSLRIELRDDNHVIVDNGLDEFFFFEIE